MKITIHTPTNVLTQQVIRLMWLLDEDFTAPTTLQVDSFPVGYPFININVEQDFIIQQLDGQEKIRTNSYLVGQSVSPFRLQVPFVKRSMVIQLQPWALPLLFRLSANEFAHQHLSLSDIDRIFSERLEELMTGSLKSNAILAGAERVILDAVNRQSADERLLAAWQYLLSSHGNINIEYLSQSVNLSQRRLEQLFQEQLGISAKAYARLVRFQRHVFDVLQSNGDLLYNVPESFFDQSHFIREVKKITGMTPAKFNAHILQAHARDAYFYSNLYYQPRV